MTTTTWTTRSVPTNLPHLTWLVPPRCQGQMVERAYALDGESGLTWRRTTDRGSRVVTYQARLLLEADDPANTEPR